MVDTTNLDVIRDRRESKAGSLRPSNMTAYYADRIEADNKQDLKSIDDYLDSIIDIQDGIPVAFDSKGYLADPRIDRLIETSSALIVRFIDSMRPYM